MTKIIPILNLGMHFNISFSNRVKINKKRNTTGASKIKKRNGKSAIPTFNNFNTKSNGKTKHT